MPVGTWTLTRVPSWIFSNGVTIIAIVAAGPGDTVIVTLSGVLTNTDFITVDSDDDALTNEDGATLCAGTYDVND